jgi:polyhydroxyalkanoate synthesis regulator phasin
MNSSELPTDISTPSTPKRSGKRTVVLGTAAGMLGGGAIGLMMLAPSLTSAAPTTDLPAVVAFQDDTTDDTTTATVTDDADRPEHGELLRTLLQDLVDDGTITSDQADAVAAHLVANRPERGDRGGRPGMGEGRGPAGGSDGQGGPGGPGRDGEVVADLLGIDGQQLREELRAGSSIADVATENGVDVQTVIDALIDDAQAHIDLAVENGRLTDDEAADRIADLTVRITAMVNGERPARPADAPADVAANTPEG